MISSSAQNHQLNRGLTNKARKWLADIIDESLQAGYCLELKPSGKKDTPVAPGSQTMFSTLTIPATDAPVAPDSQTMFGTLANTATCVPAARVQQTVKLTSSGKSSWISSVANAGTSKNLGQEGCYTESSYQGSHLRKNPRSELATDEVYSDAKRQRITRPFGEMKSN